MVLHDERTLKSTIQKNLPKSEIFARKISLAEFRYSQINLLWFTVILVHSNLNKKVTSNEQRAKSNKQRAKNKKQQTNSKEQRAKSNEQRSKSSASFELLC